MYPRGAPPGLRHMASGNGWGLRSPRRSVRFVCAVAALAAAVVVTAVVVRRLAHLPDGYGSAQDDRAASLAGRDPAELASFRSGTLRDLAYFVPGDALAFVVFLLVASSRNPPRWPGARATLSGWTKAALGLVLAATVSDAVETLLFRSTLGRLLAGTDPAVLDGRTLVTTAFTIVKAASFALAGIVFVAGETA